MPGPKKSGKGFGDERFAFMAKDPRYGRMPKQERKLKIDDRFAGMFKDKRFATNYVVDKTGRKLPKQTDDLARLYQLEDDQPTHEEEEEEEAEESGEDEGEGSDADSDGDSEGAVDEGDETTSDDDVDSEVDKDLQTWTEEEQREAEAAAHIPEGDATSRLAVLNMDWDAVKAVDILVLLNSFLPPGCHIARVTVYPSDFGLAQMAKEAAAGPSQLWEGGESKGVDEGVSQEKLRLYEEQRLKYYYAIVECDSVNAAKALYSECDGLEFEATSNSLDLRFVPEGTTFETTPRDTAQKVPINYKAPRALRKGLHHTKLECSWDHDDPVRAQKLKSKRKALSKDAEIDEDLKAYLASDSSEDGNGTDAVTEAEDEESSVPLKRRARSKFKALLQGFKDEKVDEPQQEMEIVFKPGLSEKGAELLENMEKRKVQETEGVWEAKLAKRAEAIKAKRKRRKEEAKRRENEGDEGDEEDRGLTKDEQLDPFFALDEDSDAPKRTKKKKKPKHDKPSTEETPAPVDDKQAAELALLTMGEEEEQRGFSLQSLIKKPQSKTQRKKNKGKKTEEVTAPPINVRDPRFEAIYTNPDCAIDPTHPAFTPTDGMEQLLEERRRRTRENQERQAKQASLDKQSVKGKDDSLSNLVASVKRKTANFSKKSHKPLQ